MRWYELVSMGLKVVSNHVSPRYMTADQADVLNQRLDEFSSLRWVPQSQVVGYVRPCWEAAAA